MNNQHDSWNFLDRIKVSISHFLVCHFSDRQIGKSTDVHIICFVARLWGVVGLWQPLLCILQSLTRLTASHRFSTHYGQEHCRLSRDQTILSTPELKQHWLSSGMSRLLFGFPANCVDKFDSLWVDGTVYVEEWRKFMISCQEDRKLYISWAIGCMMWVIFFSLREGCLLLPSLSINVITLAFSMGSRSFAFASAFFSYASIVSGLALFIRQQYLTKATAAEAVSKMPVFRFPWLIVVLRLIICKLSNMKNTDSSSSRFFTVSRKPV